MTREATAALGMVRALCDRGTTVRLTDEQLLQQFLARRDQAAELAFTALIARHGPIVQRVCLDVLGDSHDAQDAAQAVFLVLARKARSIRKPGSLGPWLQGVALRVARGARGEAARRRVAERRKAEIMLERDETESGPEVIDHVELHDEIDRLPEKYRAPIILCYMRGQSQREVAQALGWPLGTVQTRLHRGRERLRARLARRGAGLIAMAEVGLVQPAAVKAGVVGRKWAETTAHAAVRFAARKGLTGLVAPPVAGLAESVLAAMVAESLKALALVALSFVLAGAGLFLTVRAAEARRGGPPPTQLGARGGQTAGRKGPGSIPAAATFEAGSSVVAEPEEPLDETVVHDTESTKATGQPESALADASTPAVHRSEHHRGEGVSLSGPVRAMDAGRELFERIWVPNDPRSHEGDGLGPVFNNQSCLSCHNLGGPGGAGAIGQNIDIATASRTLPERYGFSYAFGMNFGSGHFEYKMVAQPPATTRHEAQVDSRLLVAIHPGFRGARSVVLHRFGTDPGYQAWRETVLGPRGTVQVRTSQRNPIALFGAGLIDAIPSEAIEAAATRKFPGSAQVKGRVSRLKDGRIGRFGWKAQTATLAEFVLSAAANEIGLEVPGHHQGADPRLPGLGAPGLDMDDDECNALIEYVRSLAAPVVRAPADAKDASQVKAGEATFKSIGCSSCHLAKLGNVEGIYSDLLLHDMGTQLADTDTYAVFITEPSGANDLPVANAPRGNASSTSLREWRTPPLWGLRDSGAYLHDGQAATIAQAIALHAGQGTASAQRYAELSARRKQQVEAFLMSL